MKKYILQSEDGLYFGEHIPFSLLPNLIESDDDYEYDGIFIKDKDRAFIFNAEEDIEIALEYCEDKYEKVFKIVEVEIQYK